MTDTLRTHGAPTHGASTPRLTAPVDASAPQAPTRTAHTGDDRLVDLGYTPTLRRQLGFGALLVYGLLFFVPMAPVAVFGPVVTLSGGVPVLVYLVAAGIMGLSAASYREMALRFPLAGSVYSYVRLGTNAGLGFVAGWLILLDYVLMPALLTVLSAIALGHIFPAVPIVAFSAVFVLASMLLNLQGVELTTRAGFVLLAIQLTVIAMFAVFLIRALAAGQVELSWNSVWRPGTDWSMVLSAVSIAALSYLGFDAVATLNEEARGGGRAIAWATMSLLGLVTMLFVLQVLGAALVSDATSYAEGARTDRAFYDAVDAVAPAWFTPVFTLTNAFVAIFACLVVAHSSTARLIFAMARDRVLPRPLARTTATGVPHVAVIAVAAVSLVLAVGFTNRAGLMTSLVTFGALSSYVVLHLAVINQRLLRERSRRLVIHLVVPGLGALTLLVALARTQPLTRTIGLAWLATGLLGHLAVRLLRRRTPRPDATTRPHDRKEPS